MNLCDVHRAEHQAWMDYRLPPGPIRLISIGTERERAARGNRELRYQDWLDTITRQQTLIAEHCRAQCGQRGCGCGCQCPTCVYGPGGCCRDE